MMSVELACPAARVETETQVALVVPEAEVRATWAEAPMIAARWFPRMFPKLAEEAAVLVSPAAEVAAPSCETLVGAGYPETRPLGADACAPGPPSRRRGLARPA